MRRRVSAPFFRYVVCPLALVAVGGCLSVLGTRNPVLAARCPVTVRRSARDSRYKELATTFWYSLLHRTPRKFSAPWCLIQPRHRISRLRLHGWQEA